METIAAIATPIGGGGIGIIRISGKDALQIAGSVFRRSSDSKPFESHRFYHGHIIDDNARVVDEVLVVFMSAPHSYTRENVVEIQAHSGPAVLRSILELVLKKGARMAEPGEFTKRAFLNGRIDLTQAEAVIDIIYAKTAKSLEIASASLTGGLKTQIYAMRNVLLQILTEIEAAIDFPEDVDDTLDPNTAIQIIQEGVTKPLKELVRAYEDAHFIRDGIKIAIVGKPNVGKSSLLNCLVQKDRAIVTPIPGTTRDMIEEPLNIYGMPVIIADTAGLHETTDPVESIGIRKTREYIDNCDIVLFVIDVSRALTDEDFQIASTIKEKRCILVANKSDSIINMQECSVTNMKECRWGGHSCLPTISDLRLSLPDSWNDLPKIITSALFNWGIKELKLQIADICTCGKMEIPNSIVPNLRQKTALEKSLAAVNNAVEKMQEDSCLYELIFIDLREAFDTLGDVIGISIKEDLLDQIFGKFCIGK